MSDLALAVGILFILVAVISSYFLKAAIEKSGIAKDSIEDAKYISMGPPYTTPIKSANAKMIIPGMAPSGLNLSAMVYLYTVRFALMMALFAFIAGTVMEGTQYA